MSKATITVNREYTRGKIDPRIYGSFIEHLGRGVYDGIFEPSHPSADENGFRRDVIEAVAPLNVPIVRYPGGNFVSGYSWRDGVGPVESRPRRLELAWHVTETNRFGTNEFMKWCSLAGTEAMLAVNLGTGTPAEAAAFVEYCNHPGGTQLSEMRAAHGVKHPYGVRTWCLGNEMDGPWQICAQTSAEYGRKACEAAKMMKWVDPSIELVACGSSSPHMKTYPEWDRTVLEHTYEHVDFISMHRYYGPNKSVDGSMADFLTSFADMGRFIDTVAACADYVKALKRSTKTLSISFDEWNVWYNTRGVSTAERWAEVAPIHEQSYTMLDALVFGGLICELINHGDRVRMACLAQLINCLAPILTVPGGGICLMPTYYPYLHASTMGRGESLIARYKGPIVESKLNGDAPALQTAFTYDEANGTLSMFAVNITKEPVDVAISLQGFRAGVQPGQCLTMHSADLNATNRAGETPAVAPAQGAAARVEDGVAHVALAPLSWNVVRFTGA